MPVNANPTPATPTRACPLEPSQQPAQDKGLRNYFCFKNVNSHRDRKGPGREAQNCRHFWTRVGSSRLKSVNSHRDRSVNSHRDRKGPGRETQNCRHFWTRVGSSRLKSVNSHRDRKGPVRETQKLIILVPSSLPFIHALEALQGTLHRHQQTDKHREPENPQPRSSSNTSSNSNSNSGGTSSNISKNPTSKGSSTTSSNNKNSSTQNPGGREFRIRPRACSALKNKGGVEGGRSPPRFMLMVAPSKLSFLYTPFKPFRPPFTDIKKWINIKNIEGQKTLNYK